MRQIPATTNDPILSLYIERRLNIATAWEVYLKTLGLKPRDQMHTLGVEYQTYTFGRWASKYRSIPREAAYVMRHQIIRWAIEKYANHPQVMAEMLS